MTDIHPVIRAIKKVLDEKPFIGMDELQFNPPVTDAISQVVKIVLQREIKGDDDSDWYAVEQFVFERAVDEGQWIGSSNFSHRHFLHLSV